VPIVRCTQSGRQIEAKDERVEHELFDDGDAWREADMGDGGVASDRKSDPCAVNMVGSNPSLCIVDVRCDEQDTAFFRT
jgi:hypothetical protein